MFITHHSTPTRRRAAQVWHQPLLLPTARSAVSSHLSEAGSPARAAAGGRYSILSHRAAGPDVVGRAFPSSPGGFVFVCRSQHWRLAGLSGWGQGHKNRDAIILFSIVMDTLTCHAGDCSFVPHGTICFFFFFLFLMAPPGPLNLGGILQAQNWVLHSTHSAPVSNQQRKMHIQH